MRYRNLEINNKRPIIAFYHCYLVNNWLEIFNDQLTKLLYSGLYSKIDKLIISLLGPIENREYCKRLISESTYLPFKNNIIIQEFDTNLDESCTLYSIRNYIDKYNSTEYYIMYFHMKGISNVTNISNLWRQHADAEILLNWKYHHEALQYYDVSSTNLRSNTWIGYYPHYSNNYWWTTSEYIRTLNLEYLYNKNRYLAEFWIGSSNKRGAIMHSRNNFYENITNPNLDMGIEDFLIMNYDKNISYNITL